MLEYSHETGTRRRLPVMTLSAVLLAGGESRRMGRDKATLEFRGQPLWERQLGILRALAPGKIFLSARRPTSWVPEDVELLLDDPPSRGALSGLVKALVAMRTTHLAALAVDMPFMTSEALRNFWLHVQTGGGVVPFIGERAEPLAAIYPASAVAEFSAALAGNDFSLQAIIRKLAAENKISLISVSAADEHLYRSLNEPGDL